MQTKTFTSWQEMDGIAEVHVEDGKLTYFHLHQFALFAMENFQMEILAAMRGVQRPRDEANFLTHPQAAPFPFKNRNWPEEIRLHADLQPFFVVRAKEDVVFHQEALPIPHMQQLDQYCGTSLLDTLRELGTH
ncbi:MAG: hypothetical protein IJJ26_09560 [Victivallales bacterium]|nr:hypothetical protein [Victivallales bacterium]